MLKLNRFRKLISAEQAVRKVQNHDTIVFGGFVAQSCPEHVIAELAKRFDANRGSSPHSLTVLFGGGPGDFATRGLNHLAQRKGMLKRCIGSHYGPSPMLAQRVIDNEIPGYALPLGAISNMIRCAATNTPFHISQLGLGTFVDPRMGGGALNQLARDDKDNALVRVVEFDGIEYLQFRTIPINVAIIQASTADLSGNLTMERESLLGDTRIQANAAKAAGGIVIAQVGRVVYENTLKARDVHIPGSIVDFIVHAPGQQQSYFTSYSPARSGELRTPPLVTSTTKRETDGKDRLIIARRAAMELKLHDTVNLGIGMPELVAKVGAKEGVLQHITMTTDSGVIGGQAVGGKDFGPGENYEALLESNALLDFYNGGGLDCAFLGMAQVAQNGNVNVSRLATNHLVGCGGFMDIATGTQKLVFMGTFAKKGGAIKTFQKSCGMEVTFNGPRALWNGQRVIYISERAVFSLNHRGVLKLEEVAPGMDLHKDILDHLDFVPHGLDTYRMMDARIFDLDKPCGLHDVMFSIATLLQHRIEYFQEDNLFFVDFSNLQIPDLESVHAFSKETAKQCSAKAAAAAGNTARLTVVLKMDGAKVPEDIAEQAREYFVDQLNAVFVKPEVVFWRAREHINATMLPCKANMDLLWKDWAGLGKQKLSRTGLREQLESNMRKRIMPSTLDKLMPSQGAITRSEFPALLERIQQVLFAQI